MSLTALMEPPWVAFPGFGHIEKLGVFLRTGNAVFKCRLFPGASIAPSFEDDLVGPVPDPVQGRRPEQLVIEGFSPFGEVQVAGDHCRNALVAFGDQVMEILIL